MNNNKYIMTTARHLIAALLLGTAALTQAATPVVIDNTDAGFSTLGSWAASTNVPGYQGSNYLAHPANGSPPGAIVVDNTDAGFSVTGTWPTSTSVGGYLGSNYQVHAANGEEPSAIVVDNTAGTAVGTWATSTSVGGYYGNNYQHHPAGAGANSFTWTPTIPTTGSYKVYARWTAHPNRSTQATYTVNHAGGATAVTVNQEANGGTWQLLGTFSLNAGSGHSVVLVDQGDGYVIADAIQLIPLTTTPKMYFVHTDHLNTPRLITSDTGQAVWSWANDDPYGNNAPNENPSGAGNFTCNLRLPGQYFDAELGTHYNYFRDYDPLTGRYVQSDPIGLAAGINTYAYTDSDPVGSFDPEGLTRRGAPNQPPPNQGIAQATAQTLIRQIQQYEPGFSPTFASAPGQSGYRLSDLRYLQQYLARTRQTMAPAPNYVVTSGGACLPVPTGSGLTANINRFGQITGQAFVGGSGGPGLSPATANLRLMNPTATYSSGYANYQNAAGQSINPFSGQTIPPSSPYWHIPY